MAPAAPSRFSLFGLWDRDRLFRMSMEQLLAEILLLPESERRGLIERAVDSLPSGPAPDPDLTPELRAELDRRHADMLAQPGDEVSWEEVSKKRVPHGTL
jgi:putative addiction module component (TIGR02574 family)